MWSRPRRSRPRPSPSCWRPARIAPEQTTVLVLTGSGLKATPRSPSCWGFRCDHATHRPARLLHRVQPLRPRSHRGGFRRPHPVRRPRPAGRGPRPRPAHAGRTTRLRRRHGRRRPLAAGADPARHGRTERPGAARLLRPPDHPVGGRAARRRHARRRLCRAARRRPHHGRPRPGRHHARPGPPHLRPGGPRRRHLRPARQRGPARTSTWWTPTSATAPIRISTCASAASRRPRCCAACSAAWRTHRARVRLPIVPPTVTMLTGAEVPDRPYGELIDLGQQRMAEPPYAGRVLNVSVMGGFAFADTPFNGLTVVVTATDAAAAHDLAREIAAAGWARRDRFRPKLTSLDDATAPGARHRRPRPPGADLRRCRRQPRRRRSRQHHAYPAGLPCRRRARCAGRRDPRLRRWRPRRSARRRCRLHRPLQPRRTATLSPTPSPPPPWCARSGAIPFAAGAASTPTTRWTSAPRWR